MENNLSSSDNTPPSAPDDPAKPTDSSALPAPLDSTGETPENTPLQKISKRKRLGQTLKIEYEIDKPDNQEKDIVYSQKVFDPWRLLAFTLPLLITIGVFTVFQFQQSNPPEESIDLELLAANYPADRILLRHAEVSGGLERILGLTSLSMEGILLFPTHKQSIRLFKRNPNLIRLEISSGNLTRTIAYDGQTLWTRENENPAVRIDNPQQTEEFLRDANIPTNLLLAIRDKLPVRTEPPFHRNGTLVFPLHIQLPDGRQQTSYIDARTFHERENSISFPQGSNQSPITIFQRDFRQVEGFSLPNVIHTFQNGQWSYTFYPQNVRFNPGILESFFRIPKD